MEDKKLVLNENEYIEYRIYDDHAVIEKKGENSGEYFTITFYLNNDISFIYRNYVNLSGLVKKFEIRKFDARNPLADEYNYESVKEYLTNESNTDEEKINFIMKLIKEYLKYYRPKKSWSLN